MAISCKCCKRKIFTDYKVSAKDTILYYDLMKQSFIAEETRDDWVGINKDNKIYCRICLKKRRVCFKFDFILGPFDQD